MSDLISRQAAIDKADSLYRDTKNDECYMITGYNHAISDIRAILKSLPSAQPDIARDIATIIENEQDMRVVLKNAEHTETHSCDCERTETHSCVYELKKAVTDVMKRLNERVLQTPSELLEMIQETHSCDCERTETHDWTPVSEALPKDGVTVWVTVRGHDVIRCEEGETLEQAIARISKIRWVTQGYWSEEEHGWNDPSFGCPLMVKPIAWMPIDTPEPWMGEQDVSD